MDFLIPEARSLKDRRRAMNSLKALLRSRFNCSVAEVGQQDKWGRATVVACVVSDDQAHVHEQLSEIARFSSNHHLALLSDYSMEMV